MKKVQSIQGFLLLMLAAIAFVPLSVIAEDRPDWRTNGAQTIKARKGGWDLTGTVVDVDRDGDGFALRTRGRDIYIQAQGGVSARYRGRRYRIRDLERGDRVAVDLLSTASRVPRARAVEVLESVAETGRYGRDPYGRNDRNDDYGRSDGYDRNDRYGQDGRDERLTGRIVSIDARREVMVVRADSRRDVQVDGRALARAYGRDWDRGLRTGDRVELRGMFHGGLFVADAIEGGSGYGRYDPYGRR